MNKKQEAQYWEEVKENLHLKLGISYLTSCLLAEEYRHRIKSDKEYDNIFLSLPLITACHIIGLDKKDPLIAHLVTTQSSLS